MRYDGSGGLGRMITVLTVTLLGVPAVAQQAIPTAPPGFRPGSPQAAAFVESCTDARLAVLPTLVRGVDRMSYSVASQERIVQLLSASGLGTPTAADLRIDLGITPEPPQWHIFQRSLRSIGSALDPWPADADYALVMEVLLPPGERVVFGIETYILDRRGRDAFSFILNSHHEVFSKENLVRRNDTEEALQAMVLDATRVAVSALRAQIDFARECAAWMADHPPQPMAAGVLEDFDNGLAALQDAYANPLGFSTFQGGRSRVEIDATTGHPPRQGEAPGNHALRVELDVQDWAGFVYLPHDPATRTWEAQDWSPFQGISFWMHGNDSGARLYLHVFDNRNPCSTADDAERFGYVFVDDFTGWKQFVIPFEELSRAEVGNDAPNDGLGLTRVHGWAFGATRTPGPTTFFLDDVALWTEEPG